MHIESAKIMINNRCNLRCDYCCLEPQSKKELSVNEWVMLLTHLKDNFDTKYIDLFGKEPLFDRKAFELIETLNSKGIAFSYSMITNGVNLKKYCAEIIDLLDSISVSYSGLDKGREYTFDAPTITHIAKHNKCVEISYDLQKGNVANLISDLEMFWNIGVGSVYIKPILDYNNKSSEYALNEAEFEKVVRDLLSHDTLSIPYLLIHIPFIFGSLTNKFKDFTPTPKCEVHTEPKCLCNGSFMFIDCDGTAYPCGECLSLNNKSAGFNYLHTPIEDIQKKLTSNGERLCMVRK